MSDFYEILGVSKNATKDEIKQAFRQSARKLHPDVNKEPDAEDKFKELGKAYETLIDDEKRAMYDRYGEEGLANAGFNTQSPFEFGFGDLNEIFETFFGGAFGGGFSSYHQDPNAPQRGSDLRLNIKLEFKEAVFGVEKQIKIDHLELCEACHGSGCEPGTKPSVCQTCGGTGQVQQTTRTPIGSFTQVGICPNCRGAGRKNTSPCKKCNGEGLIKKEKTISVKIPAGVDNKTKIRVANEGDAGKNKGPNGDLYIVTLVKEDNYFKRDDYNVFSEIEINMPQAIFGDEIEIETLDGKKTLKIPAFTQSEKVFSMKGLGVPVLGHHNLRGDHFIVTKVKTPVNLNDEEKKLYARLYEISRNKKPTETIFDKVKGVLHN